MCYLKRAVPVRLARGDLAAHARFSSCAVVANSGALLSRRAGEEIDSHSAVFRFNDAPTAGFEAMVGSKETVRVTGRKGLDRAGGRAPAGALVAWADSDGAPVAPGLGRQASSVEGDPFTRIREAMQALFDDRWWHLGTGAKSFEPTIGAVGMLLAMSLCNTTDAYDMSPSEVSSTAPFHYYGAHSHPGVISADDNTWHKTFEAERDLWARLSTTPADEVFATGRATLLGFAQVPCEGVDPPQGRIALAQSGVRTAQGTKPALLLVLGACLALAAAYLVVLWAQRDLLTHIGSGLTSASSAPGACALLVYLVMLVSLDLLIKREAEHGHGHYSVSPLVVVPIVECGKFLVSSVLYIATKCHARLTAGPAAAPAGADGDELLRREWDGALQVAKLMAPVALLYNSNNVLNLVCLANVRLDAYAVWRNLSILFNAVIWVWALNRKIEFHRWIAVSVCLLGSCFNTLGTDGSIVVDAALSGVLLSALLSSVASVFNERVIKSEEAEPLSINQVNLLLYAETLGLMLLGGTCVGLVWGFPSLATVRATLAAISPGAWRIICMQVAMGLAVSRVLKHADAVAKTVVGSLRDVAIVFIAPHVVAGTRFDAISVGSALLVGIAGMIYSMPAGRPADPAALGQLGPACRPNLLTPKRRPGVGGGLPAKGPPLSAPRRRPP